MDRQTRTIVQQIQTPDTVRYGFNAIRFTNKGTQPALVNNYPLLPGESYGWGLNANEIDTGSYHVDFPAGNDGASVWVTSIFYL